MPYQSDPNLQKAIDEGRFPYDALAPEDKSFYKPPGAATATAPPTGGPGDAVPQFLKGAAHYLSGGFNQDEKAYGETATPATYAGELGGAFLPPLAGAAIGGAVGGIPGALAGLTAGGFANIPIGAARVIDKNLDAGQPLTLTNTGLPIGLMTAANLIPVPGANAAGGAAARIGLNALAGYGGDVAMNASDQLQNTGNVDWNTVGRPGLGTGLGAAMGTASVGANAALKGFIQNRAAREAADLRILNQVDEAAPPSYPVPGTPEFAPNQATLRNMPLTAADEQLVTETATPLLNNYKTARLIETAQQAEQQAFQEQQLKNAVEMGARYIPVGPDTFLDLSTGQTGTLDAFQAQNPNRVFDATIGDFVEYTPTQTPDLPPEPAAPMVPYGQRSGQLVNNTLEGRIVNDDIIDTTFRETPLLPTDALPPNLQLPGSADPLALPRPPRQLPGSGPAGLLAAPEGERVFTPDSAGNVGMRSSDMLPQQQNPNEATIQLLSPLQRQIAQEQASREIKSYLQLFERGLDPRSDSGQALMQAAINARRNLFQKSRVRVDLDNFLMRNGVNPASLGQELFNPRYGAAGGYMLFGNAEKTAEKKSPDVKKAFGIAREKFDNLLRMGGQLLTDAANYAGGEEGVRQVIKAQLSYEDTIYRYVAPVKIVAQSLGVWGEGNKDLNREAARIFRTTPLADIVNGNFAWPNNVDVKYRPLVQLMAKGFTEAPEHANFVGRSTYVFGEGYKFPGQDAPELMFDVVTGRAVEKSKTKDQLAYGSMLFDKKDLEATPDVDKNFVQLYAAHMDKIARQKAAQPTVIQNGKTVVLPNQDSPFNFFSNIAQNRVLNPDGTFTPGAYTPQQQSSAQLVIDRFKNKPIVPDTSYSADTERAIRKAQANYTAAVLSQRASAFLKNIGPLLGLTDLKPELMLRGVTDSFTDPTARQVVRKHAGITDQAYELMVAGVAQTYNGESAGFDLREAGENLVRAATLLGRLQQEGVPYAEVLKMTPRAKEALIKAKLDFKTTQPSYSIFTMPAASANTYTNLLLQFKRAKLAEYEAVTHLVKTKNWAQLGRYMLTGYVTMGPRAFLDSRSWQYLRSTGALASLQQATGLDLEGLAQAGQEGEGYGMPIPAQLLQPMVGNADLLSSSAESFVGIPGLTTATGQPENMMFDVLNVLINQNKHDSAPSQAGAAVSALGNLLGTKNVGGVQVSADVAKRAITSGASLLGPDAQKYGRYTIEKNPTGDIARLTISGNKDKKQVRELSGDRILPAETTVLKNNFIAAIKAKDLKRADGMVQEYVKRYGKLLTQQKKYEGLSGKDLEDAVFEMLAVAYEKRLENAEP